MEEVKNVRSIRFPKSLEKRIGRASEDFSEFVRQACIEKLSRKLKEDKDNEGVEKFIDEMIALHPKRRIADIQNSSDLIFMELKKQNEILKLLLRRTTMSSKYSSTMLAMQSKEQLQADLKFVEERVASDLKNINLQWTGNEDKSYKEQLKTEEIKKVHEQVQQHVFNKRVEFYREESLWRARRICVAECEQENEAKMEQLVKEEEQKRLAKIEKDKQPKEIYASFSSNPI